jgi:hypothetical protein
MNGWKSAALSRGMMISSRISVSIHALAAKSG